MVLKLYKIDNHELILIEKCTPRDVILISDESERKLYVYRGMDSLNLNEFEAEHLYELIMQKFLNSQIYLIYTTVLNTEDSSQIKKIKRFITTVENNNFRYKFYKMFRKLFLLGEFRDQARQLKQFSSSNLWKKKLTNVTNIWKLSLFNSCMIGLVIIGLGLKFGLDVIPTLQSGTASQIWLENTLIYLMVGMFVLILVFVVNIVFFLFPMSIPIRPIDQKTIKGKN